MDNMRNVDTSGDRAAAAAQLEHRWYGLPYVRFDVHGNIVVDFTVIL